MAAIEDTDIMVGVFYWPELCLISFEKLHELEPLPEENSQEDNSDIELTEDESNIDAELKAQKRKELKSLIQRNEKGETRIHRQIILVLSQGSSLYFLIF